MTCKTRWHVSLYYRGNPKPHRVQIFRLKRDAIDFAHLWLPLMGSVRFETVDTRAPAPQTLREGEG